MDFAKGGRNLINRPNVGLYGLSADGGRIILTQKSLSHLTRIRTQIHPPPDPPLSTP